MLKFFILDYRKFVGLGFNLCQDLPGKFRAGVAKFGPGVCKRVRPSVINGGYGCLVIRLGS
jgi:hypothetical protein